MQNNHPPKILIVDDEPQNIHLLGQTLKNDYQIIIATSGHQAMDKLKGPEYPDIILLDVIMPDINGFDICKELKTRPETRDIPVIFVTAMDSHANEQEALEIGGVDFIIKPFNNAIIQARVKTHLDIVRQQRQIKHSEALLKSTLEATKDGIIVFDNSGKLLMLNQNFIMMWGFPPEVIASGDKDQFLDYGLNQLVDGDARRENLEMLWQSDNKDSSELELKDGRIFSRYSEPLIQDGDKVGRVISYTDISTQKILEKQLTRLSITDPLTGLYNRRRLHEIIHDEFIRATRYQRELSVLMMDIDHFKQFNDNYGHEIGDQILEQLSSCMKAHFRNVDWCCRMGGEEFCVIMPDADLAGAMDAAERFRQLILAMRVDDLTITISIGIASLHDLEPGEDPDELLNYADKALYTAKNNGRNQVKHYQPKE